MRRRGDQRPARTALWSLAALLDERLHEVLGVGLEHLVDLVQDRVDVLVELFLALGDVGLGGLGGLDLLLAALAGLLLLLCHLAPPVLGSAILTANLAPRPLEPGRPVVGRAG